MALEKLYTIPELAVYFQVSEKCVKNWYELGLIKFGKFGGVVRVLESEVENFVEKSYQKVIKRYQMDRSIAIDKLYMERRVEGFYSSELSNRKI